jgi:hypothetical protein
VTGSAPNQINTTSCRWDITAVPGRTSDTKQFAGYAISITSRNLNSRVLFPLPLGIASNGRTVCPANNDQGRPWNVVRSITVGGLQFCRNQPYQAVSTTSQAARHYCSNGATFVAAPVAALGNILRNLPLCYQLTLALTDGRSFNTQLRVTRT